MDNISTFAKKHSFLLINIPLFYFFHIYTFFTYFLFYIFIKYNKSNIFIENNQENINSENINSENINSENINSENINSENINSENINSENSNSDNSRDINLKKINTNNINKYNFKKNISRDFDLKNINKYNLKKNIREISLNNNTVTTNGNNNVDTRFFILATYFITIYYGYIFICDLIIKISIVGFVYFIYKKYNNKYINDVIKYIDENDKYKPIVNYLYTVYDILYPKIILLQKYINEIKPEDITNSSSIYYKTIIIFFDYIHDKIITDNIITFINTIYNNVDVSHS